MFFPLTMAVLSFIAIKNWHVIKSSPPFTIREIFIGFLSGLILYIVFFVSYLMIKKWFPLFIPYVIDLYKLVGPTQLWQYVLLITIIIPGEELFWRGYVQNKLSMYVKSDWSRVFFASVIYGFAHIWTANPMLIAAALIGGMFWGSLYIWNNNIGVVILSHYTFNLFLLFLLPLTF